MIRCDTNTPTHIVQYIRPNRKNNLLIPKVVLRPANRCMHTSTRHTIISVAFVLKSARPVATAFARTIREKGSWKYYAGISMHLTKYTTCFFGHSSLNNNDSPVLTTNVRWFIFGKCSLWKRHIFQATGKLNVTCARVQSFAIANWLACVLC